SAAPVTRATRQAPPQQAQQAKAPQQAPPQQQAQAQQAQPQQQAQVVTLDSSSYNLNMMSNSTYVEQLRTPPRSTYVERRRPPPRRGVARAPLAASATAGSKLAGAAPLAASATAGSKLAGAAPVAITVSPLEWWTLPFAGQPSLVAVRQVETPGGRLVQGF